MDIYHFDTVSSTQDTAKAYLAESCAVPFVVIADEQTQGRGRSGHQWVSLKGNLYSSIVIPLDNVSVKDVGQYSFVTAVALMDCLDDYGVTNARNKWPNDILVDGQKIAGILLESDIGEDGLLTALIIGVGVNLVHAPDGAVSLYDHAKHHDGSGQKNARGFLNRLLSHLQTNLDMMKQTGFSSIREKWLIRAYGLGSIIRVRLPNETFYGEFTGLDTDGALLVQVDGHPKKVYSGDVFFGT